jgi:hypothetical protein
MVKETIAAAQGRARRGEISPEEVAENAIATLPAYATSLRYVVNATGVIIHTNLGRAPLSAAVREALSVASGATDVEYDLSTGRRATRGRGALEALAAAVPGAEAVHVVNNNAAALLLCALALARDLEIVISRGELVEIGDGFRIPDLFTSAGAILREVGTTNRCALADYADAIGPRTAFVLKVHPSSFVISGFTSSVDVADLATLGRPVVVDIGSGLLTPHPAAARRAGRRHRPASRCGARHGQRRQAAGRAASRSAARPVRTRRPATPTPGRPCAPGRQAHPGRTGGDPHRTTGTCPHRTGGAGGGSALARRAARRTLAYQRDRRSGSGVRRGGRRGCRARRIPAERGGQRTGGFRRTAALRPATRGRARRRLALPARPTYGCAGRRRHPRHRRTRRAAGHNRLIYRTRRPMNRSEIECSSAGPRMGSST